MILEPAPPPDEALRRLLGLPRPFLLESGSDADGCGRASFVGCDPCRVHTFTLGDTVAPLAPLALRRDECIAVGYLGYGLGSALLRKVPACRDDRGLPELCFAFYDAVYRYDHASARGELLGRGHNTLRDLLRNRRPRTPAPFSAGPLRSPLTEQRYREQLQRILEYIRAGDIYQVSFTHRLSAPFVGNPAAAYLALRRFGAPFSAYLDLRVAQLIANSPERFLQIKGRAIESRPIKGTRPRRPGAAAELAACEKERAEHLMIVDLVRSDLGRVCETGSVRVDGFSRVVELPTLHHMISTVAGQLRSEVSLAEVLRATFPGGSVTGAPKVRAMQIIDELEAEARGPYTGAFGRIGPGDEVDLAMTIRTAVCSGGRIDLGVGGGIVADSRPDAEWQETLLKAQAFIRTLLPPAEMDAPAAVAG